MKKLIKIICLTLCLCLLACAVGCANEPDDDDEWTPFIKIENEIL